MKLSEMKAVLTEREIQLTKSLGQNFLHDRNQLRRIVEAAELSPTDKVLEIGPGLGPLTELLLENCAEVLAIEKDLRLVEVLKQRFVQCPNLRLVPGDALEFLRRSRDWKDWKLVANLPYSVASPILVELAEADEPPLRCVATLQLEVAERLIAESDDSHYGVLSLLVQLAYEPLGSFRIPASCFFPEPEIASTCVILGRRTRALLPKEQRPLFKELVKLSFSQRRKMMIKLLKERWPVELLKRAFQEAGLSLQARAEAATLAQYISLATTISQKPSE